MIGNDVVDLAEAETHGLHPRWDERVFAPVERRALAASPEPGRLRWILWSGKEAAYKAASRLRATIFSPRRFVVEVRGCQGSVRHGGDHYSLELRQGSDWVHAHARTDPAPQPLWTSRVLKYGEDPGVAARALAVATLARALDRTEEALSILRVHRQPALSIGGRISDAVLSLSHHGRYVAFACALPRDDR